MRKYLSLTSVLKLADKKRTFHRKFKSIYKYFLDKYFSLSKTSGRAGDADFHVDFIVHLSSILRPKCYVELGVYQCETFNRVSKFAKESYAVDINPDAGNFINNIESFHCSTTEDFLKFFDKTGKKIDLLFIDADHSASAVEFEFTKFFKYIVDQGIILLHDGFPLDKSQTSPAICGDGFKAIDKLSRQSNQNGYEMVTIPFPPGLTVCRKREQQALFL